MSSPSGLPADYRGGRHLPESERNRNPRDRTRAASKGQLWVLNTLGLLEEALRRESGAVISDGLADLILKEAVAAGRYTPRSR